jgi:hypothetical protein
MCSKINEKNLDDLTPYERWQVERFGSILTPDDEAELEYLHQRNIEQTLWFEQQAEQQLLNYDQF